MPASTFMQAPNGDWQILAGRLILTRDPVVVAAIKVRNRLKLFLGEWYGDIRIGVPYREVVFAKGADQFVVARVIRDVILSVGPTIETCDEVRVGLDRVTRRGYVFFRATANDKRPLSGGTDVPFILGSDYLPPA